MPTRVVVLLQGLIDVYQKRSHQDTQVKSVAKTSPGSRVLK